MSQVCAATLLPTRHQGWLGWVTADMPEKNCYTFHLSKVPGIGKLRETENRTEVTRGWGKWGRESYSLIDSEFLLGVMEKCVEGDAFNATELYAEEGLKRKLLCYMCFTTI